MKKAHLAWLLGSALVMAAGGISTVACSSSDNGSGTPSGGDAGGTTDGSTGNKDGSATGDSGGGTGDSGGSNDAGTGAECGSTPSLHQDDAGDIYCGFSKTLDAGLVCPTGMECCIGGKQGSGFADQQCAGFGSACTNPVDAGLPVECAQNSDCVANGQANTVCCLVNSTAQMVSGCGYYQAKGGDGIKCQASCAAADTQVCSSDADCSGGKKCNAGKWKILQVGFCE